MLSYQFPKAERARLLKEREDSGELLDPTHLE